MEWIDALAEWILFPLLIVYGFTSWAKDHPKQNLLDPFRIDDAKNCHESSSEKTQDKNKSH